MRVQSYAVCLVLAFCTVLSVAGPVADGAGKAKAKPKVKDVLPAGVTIVQRGSSGGAVSPDGATLAFWTGLASRKISLYDIASSKATAFAPGEKKCSASACMDRRCPTLAWSPDGASLAYAVDDGLHVLDVATKKARKVDAQTCDFAFSPKGDLYWLRGGGDELWREHDGVTKLLAKLPTSTFHELNGHLFMCGKGGYQGDVSELWLGDLGGTSKRVFRQASGADPMWSPKIAPTGDRICWMSDAIRCMTVANHKVSVISKSVPPQSRWGHERQIPFSPSGKRFAFRQTKGDVVTLVVHDFASGKNKQVVADLRYQDYAFQGEDHIVLYEPADWRDESTPGVSRVDLTTGKLEVLVAHDSEYNAPVFIPGRVDLFFIGRERPHTGSRDLVRVEYTSP